MFGSAYILVVIGILAAKGLGFVRDMVFAGTFGTGTESDIYFQVFGLVNLIFTGIGVALSTLVIKNINKPENSGNEQGYAASFLKKSFLLLVCAALLIVFSAKWIVGIILPELTGEDFLLAVKMVYIMAPSVVFVVVAYIISGLLQNKQVYFITSIMSVPFNVAIISCLFIKNVSIETIAAVTTFGWFLHIVVQLPSFYKQGYRMLSSNKFKGTKNDKNTEIIWIFISNMMFQLCVYTDRAFVSGTEGMASTFNYASNLFITISSVFVVAMSTVVFPSISKNYEEGNLEYVNGLVKYILTIMAAIFLPFILVTAFFGEDVIRLLYERGAFDSEATKKVASMFFLYTLGSFGYIAQELYNKVLYIAGKYKYTVYGTISVIALNVGVNVLVSNLFRDSRDLAVVIIAGSTSILLTLYAVMVSVAMKKVIGPYFHKDMISDIAKIVFSLILAAIVYFGCDVFAKDFTHGYLSFMVPLVSCGAGYIGSLYFTGVLAKLIKREKKGMN